MKKILTILIIVGILSVSLAGCSTPIESTISSAWKAYENYTYEVKDDSGIVGTLNYSSERFDNQTLTLGGTTYENMSGTKIWYDLVINNSTDKVSAEVYYTTSPYRPFYSYKEILNKGISTVITAKYSGNDYKYTINIDGTEKSDELSVKKMTYYDNEMVYYIIRSTDLTSKNYSFTINVPSPQENKVQSRTVSRMSSEDEESIMGSTIKCYKMQMSANEKITGSSYQLYYAVNPLTADGQSIVKPLVKFVEGEFTYTLTALTTVKA